jgi:hypothetical protein
MTSLPAAPSPLLRGLMVWTLFAVPVVVAVRPVGEPLYDPDVWWHLGVGQWVVEHRAVPAHDPFSQVGQGRPWVAYSWLYEVVLYGLYQALGVAGIVVYRALTALAVVWAVYALVRRLERRFLAAAGLTGAAVLAMAMLFSERPWLLTVLFATLTLHAVVVMRRAEDSPGWVWALPLVFVVWANVHIQFVYGLFLLALGCVAPLIDRRLGWRGVDWTASWPGTMRYRRLVTLSVFCLAATLANPYGVRLYAVVLEYATQPGPFRWVNELKGPDFREACHWVVLGLTGAACVMLGRRKPSSFEILLLLAAGFLAFRAQRDLWFLVLADLLVLASAGPAEVPAGERFSLSLRGRALVLAGLALLAGWRAWQQDLSPAGLHARVAARFPVDAAAFVEKEGYEGPLYNDFNWGGYLIWALPRLPVAIDGRTNLHGDERIERFGRVWAGLPGWQDDPDLSAAGVVIAEADSALVSLLLLDHRFRLAYQDKVACVFVPSARKS